jgi:hypothetical protein
MGRCKRLPGFANAPGVFDNPLTGSGGRLCRGALSSGAFWEYLSGSAAVETAGEKIAAAYAHGRPHRAIPQKTKIKIAHLR